MYKKIASAENIANYNWEDQEKLVTFEMSLEEISKKQRERRKFHPGLEHIIIFPAEDAGK